MTTNNQIKKEILYRSNYRGCKETDQLIGKFVESKLDYFSDEDVLVVRDLVLEDDLQIYDWIMSRGECPKKYMDLVVRIQEFHAIDNLS